MYDHVSLAQLLCSRMCHDLISPVGAVNAGLELIEESDGGAPEALDLITRSAGETSTKLEFFRAAFGFTSGTLAPIPISDTRRLATNWMESGKSVLNWMPSDGLSDGDYLSPRGLKVLLCLIVMAVECVPRGGTVNLSLANFEDGLGIAIAADGDSARLREDLNIALDPNTTVADLNSRNVHAFYAASLSRSAGGSLEVDEQPNVAVQFAALVPSTTA